MIRLHDGVLVMSMKKILIVDDCTDYAYSLQKLLQHCGYDTDTAASLTEAKEKIDKEMPLLICSDLDLQDGSAFELLDAIKVSEPQIPFLVMSCHEMDDWESEAVQRGAAFCLDKMKIELVKDKLLEYACRESLDAKPAEETCRLSPKIGDAGF